MATNDGLLRHGTTFSEQVRRVETRVRPAEMPNMTATGDTDEFSYAGRIEECQAFVGDVLATASSTAQVRTVLTRSEGGNAEVQATVTYFRSSTQDASRCGGSGCGGGSESGTRRLLPTAGSWGHSKEAPVYEFQPSVSQESILTHPRIVEAALDEYTKFCLAYVANGGGPDDIVMLPGQIQDTPRNFISSRGASEFLDLVLRAPQYLDPQGTLVVSWEVAPDSPSESFPEVATIQVPEGPIRAKSPRNWLYVGGTYKTEGKVTKCVKNYRLSGPNGWDPEIYGEHGSL